MLLLWTPGVWLILGVSSWVHLAIVQPADDETGVSVTVLSIFAHSRDAQVDPCLHALARELQKTHPCWTGFRLAKSMRTTIPIGSSRRFEVVKDTWVKITVQALANGRTRLTIRPPKGGGITYICRCGKFFPLLTRHCTPKGEQLIIAVMAKPCERRTRCSKP